MPADKKGSGGKKNSSGTRKKDKKNVPQEDVLDLHQEQIDGLIREREEIRAKLNRICSKIIENINLNDYQDDVDLTKQQPSDISVNTLSSMIDQISHYRLAFLNLFQETDDNENISVQKKITQLSLDEPNLFRKHLTLDQRLTFVARERDLWKENAQQLQIMYATIVDQLEMGIFKKPKIKTNDILHAHRLNLEDVCIIFSSPSIQLINDVQKIRTKTTFDELKDQHTHSELDQQDNFNISSNQTENKEHHHVHSSTTNKLKVSFADAVDIINKDEEIDLPPQATTTKKSELLTNKNQFEEKILNKNSTPHKSHLPLANETLVEKMDSNLRMLIIKELSKHDYIQRPLSRMSSVHGMNTDNLQHRSRNNSPEWVELARLIGIDESEIEHWLSQSLQYPASRVISTWCNHTSPPPTVAKLHLLISSNELNRVDLARCIETMYVI